MPSYAVLGVTGKTGQSIIRILLQSPDNQIHAYCRSKQKLTQLVPDIGSNGNVKVFEGSLNDVELLADCIRGTRAVFLAVAASDNLPGCTIAQDTAHVVVSALKSFRERN